MTALEIAISKIEKKFGVGKVVNGDIKTKTVKNRFPTGSFSYDISIGGGHAYDKVQLLWGNPSSGKTTAAFRAIAGWQYFNKDRYVAVIAAEGWDTKNAKANGVVLDKTIIIYPETMEEGFNEAEILLRTGDVGLLVVDSTDMLIPAAELEGSMDQGTRSISPRLLNKFLKKLGTIMAPKPEWGTVTVIFVSQMRYDQNVKWGSGKTFNGGRGYRHAHQIVSEFSDQTNSRTIKSTLNTVRESAVGQSVEIHNFKNKTYPPQGVAEYDYYYNHHIDKKYKIKREFVHGMVDHSKEIIQTAIEHRVLKPTGKDRFLFRTKKYSLHQLAALLDAKPVYARSLMKQICKKIKPRIPTSSVNYYYHLLKTRQTKIDAAKKRRKVKSAKSNKR